MSLLTYYLSILRLKIYRWGDLHSQGQQFLKLSLLLNFALVHIGVKCFWMVTLHLFRFRKAKSVYQQKHENGGHTGLRSPTASVTSLYAATTSHDRGGRGRYRTRVAFRQSRFQDERGQLISPSLPWLTPLESHQTHTA